jgi:hypothetical protein
MKEDLPGAMASCGNVGTVHPQNKNKLFKRRDILIARWGKDDFF